MEGDMDVIVLGKYGPFPKAGGGTSSYLVRDGYAALALDFGSGALGRVQNHIPLERLSGVVISHYHYDHIADLPVLSYAFERSEKPCPVYVPDIDCPEREFLTSLKGLKVTPYGKVLNLGGLSILFTPLQHSVPNFGMRIMDGVNSLFYSGDTTLCPALTAAAKGCDFLILDCGKPEGTDAPHLTQAEAAQIGAELDIPVLASHLNPAVTYNDSTLVAQEGETYKVLTDPRICMMP